MAEARLCTELGTCCPYCFIKPPQGTSDKIQWVLRHKENCPQKNDPLRRELIPTS